VTSEHSGILKWYLMTYNQICNMQYEINSDGPRGVKMK